MPDHNVFEALRQLFIFHWYPKEVSSMEEIIRYQFHRHLEGFRKREISQWTINRNWKNVNWSTRFGYWSEEWS